MNKTSYANSTYRRIASIARPYYPADGKNSWAHIQEVRRRAAKMMRRLEGRSLTPAEYAAVMLHDNTKHDMGAENHGRTGAERARLLLAVALTPQEIDEAANAIAVHDDNLKEFPSHTAELLASADANPPDLEWALNKSYNWQISHGLKGDARYAAALAKMIPKYGINGKFNVPGIYADYYGDAVPKYQKAMTEMTLEKMKTLLTAYRDKYGIGPDEPRVIHNR